MPSWSFSFSTSRNPRRACGTPSRGVCLERWATTVSSSRHVRRAGHAGSECDRRRERTGATRLGRDVTSRCRGQRRTTEPRGIRRCRLASERRCRGQRGGALVDTAPGYFAIVVSGKLRNDLASSQAAHNQFFSAAEQNLGPAGYVRHHALLGASDSTSVLIVGIWTNVANFQSAAGTPQFQQFFASFFAGQPSLTIAATTNWEQW
jgi:hypothetical protein